MAADQQDSDFEPSRQEFNDQGVCIKNVDGYALLPERYDPDMRAGLGCVPWGCDGQKFDMKLLPKRFHSNKDKTRPLMYKCEYCDMGYHTCKCQLPSRPRLSFRFAGAGCDLGYKPDPKKKLRRRCSDCQKQIEKMEQDGWAVGVPPQRRCNSHGGCGRAGGCCSSPSFKWACGAARRCQWRRHRC